MPEMLPEEVFEDRYTLKFKELVLGRGLLANFERDRARIDIGIMLNRIGSLELSGVKVWFQLKGIHAKTLSAKELGSSGYASLPIRLDDLRFWYASPEATYLVVYIEATDQFLAEDVRDIVDREWGPEFLRSGRFGSQNKITVRVSVEAVLTESVLDGMVAHRSMRIDGPAFRGRPLGHRFDPLRCELAPLAPDVFDRLVARLLDAHLLHDIAEVDPSRLLKGVGDSGHRLRMLTGTLHTTYEFPFAGSIEYGFGRDVSVPRSEGQWFSAIGRVAVVVHSKVADLFEVSERLPELLAEWDAAGIRRILVFSNASDMDIPIQYRKIFGKRCDVPQGLSSIAYNVLIATLVYMEFQEHLRWKWVNFQYQ